MFLQERLQFGDEHDNKIISGAFEVPECGYDVIYADPPWAYKSRSGRDFQHGSEMKYGTMTVEEICSLNIPAAKDSVLFLWVTVPLLPEGLQVMAAWGYKYKTMITWRKVMSMGMGFWWRGQTEHLLFGMKGNVRAYRMQEANFVQAKAGRHSEKPHAVRRMIERATVGKTRLEMFARIKAEGWHVWGNEVESDVVIDTKK